MTEEEKAKQQVASRPPNDFKWAGGLDKMKPKSERLMSRALGIFMMVIGIGMIWAAISIHSYETAFLLIGGIGFIVLGLCSARGNS